VIKHVDFFPEDVLVNMPGDEYTGVISICDIDHNVDRLFDHRWAQVLRLKFDDIDHPRPHYHLFTETQARHILQWLEKHAGSLLAIYVHCWAGVSRSAAVARFIARKYGLPFDEAKGKSYNRYVYSMLESVDAQR